MHLVEADWELWFNPAKLRHLNPLQFTPLVKMSVDFILPSQRRYGQEEFHRFNDYTRKTFATALRAKIRQAKSK